MPLSGEYEPGTSKWAATQAEQFEASGGRKANTIDGRPIIVLTSVGAKSGKIRKTALMRVEHDGEYAAFASQGGQEANPTWYHNLTANPHVELQDGSTKKDYIARVTTGEERDTWWQRGVEAFPQYADYAKKTTRVIPVFVLTPMDPA